MFLNKGTKYRNVLFSVLDLAPVLEDSHPAQSFTNSVSLAQHVEHLGFNRYWLAEHHNMPGIASSATAILINHIANATKTIRVGSGGIMLPNHASLVIAEQFGTLESLFPGRIDLGLGRAPGTDQATALALRKTLNQGPEEFPRQVIELENYFSDNPIGSVQAIPGKGLNVPIWLLGSSDYSARLAAEKGLPFSFAGHFSPRFMMDALAVYRNNFKPSDMLSEPYVMLGINIMAGQTNDEAHFLATSQQQQFISLRRNEPTKLKRPVKNIKEVVNASELNTIKRMINSKTTMVGNLEEVKQKLDLLIDETGADEFIINSQIYDHDKRLQSYKIIANLFN